MGKKRSWFSLVKRLFIPEAKSEAEKKSKRWRWMFGRLKFKQCPALAAPRRTLTEVTEEQRKHAFAVAVATAAAAEAAVAAAHAAAEIVLLTTAPHEFDKTRQNLAATKIQAAYRRHLARKALRALKGVVRLQAVVRGQLVRSRITDKVKCFPSIAKAQSPFHQMRIVIVDGNCKDGEKKQCLGAKMEFNEKEQKLECNSHRSWDCSLFSKNDMEALWLRKQEAIAKRERMKKYSFFHREGNSNQTLEESLTNEENGRQENPFEGWADDVAHKRWRKLKKLKSTLHSNFIAGDTYGTTQLKQRNAHKQDSIVEMNSTFSLPRRSFCHAKQKSIGDDNSLPCSPVFPTYMAATESAKAKARSMSTPKQRLGIFDTYLGHSSPHKLRLSSWSSFNGEMACSNRKSCTSQQIFINTKGLYRD